MQVTKYHSVGAYLINAILLINLLNPSFFAYLRDGVNYHRRR